MNFSNILLGALIVFFIVHFVLAIREGNKKKTPYCLVCKQTGQTFPLDAETMAQLIEKEIQLDFTHTAKVIFSQVANAFAKGHLSCVKSYLNEKVLPVFQEAIAQRDSLKQTTEFSLIGFKEVKIISDEPNKKIVTFTTEQVNLLKDADNNVIEGDPLYVATVTENWTFEKKGENAWVVSAIENMEAHFA